MAETGVEDQVVGADQAVASFEAGRGGRRPRARGRGGPALRPAASIAAASAGSPAGVMSGCAQLLLECVAFERELDELIDE